jgi:predicted aconitase
MQLREKEKDMLDGKYGPGHQRCMKILVAVGECYGSERMVPVTSVHIAGNYSVMESGEQRGERKRGRLMD